MPILAMMVGLHLVGSLLGAVRDHVRWCASARVGNYKNGYCRAASVRLSLFDNKALLERMQWAQWCE